MSIAPPTEIEITPANGPDGQSGSTPERPLLSIVIPVRDAAAELPATLNAITQWIARSTIGVEVVVIDDASSDGTRATASSFRRRIQNLQVLRHVERRGQLEAVRTGEQASSGELIAFGGALVPALDATTDLMAALLEGADIAVLEAPPPPRVTPMPLAAPRMSLAGACAEWFRRRMARPIRNPALVLCRTTALRKMMVAAKPEDGDPDWLALARRAKCALSVVRRRPASTRSRPLPAPAT